MGKHARSESPPPFAYQTPPAATRAPAHARTREHLLLSAVVEGIPHGFQMYDGRWRLTYMNAASARMLTALGVDPASMIGKHYWDDLFPALRGTEFFQRMQRAMSARVAASFEAYNPQYRRWYETRIFPLPDGALGNVFSDVTERKLAEEGLRAMEHRFRSVADSAPIIVWVTDSGGSNTFANQAFLEFVGITREESGTFDWTSAVHPEDREVYLAAFLAAVRERTPFHARMRARRRDGAWRWLESRGNPQLDAAGALTAYIGCSLDITESLESQAALQEADRRKDEFLAMLAHELRNPLASIMSGTRLLRRLPASALESEETRDMIERQVGQLSRLVDDLLDVSRITSGRIVMRKELIDLRGVVSHAVEMSRPLIDARRHRLSISVPGEPAPVEGDATRLAQVISNLLNNAAKYTAAGGEIRLNAEVTYDEVWVRVADNGIGIAASDLPRIFELFSRIERSQGYAEGGLGIGLTLARRLAELHSGTLQGSSEGPGRGSEFMLRLPQAAAPAREARPARPAADAEPHRRRILLIDDNESFANAMAGLLQLKGHEVRAVHDGATALAAAREFRPQVVLLDIGLPGMRGYDIAREMRKDAALARTTIIAMTGYGREQDQRQALAAGIDHHLTKPVDDEALTVLLDAAP